MKKIIIIGAGPAGLTTAYELLKKTEFKVIIVEKDKVVGGISKTINYKGNRMDLGGHRFFSKDEYINKIWKELLPLQGKKSIDDIITNTDKKIEEFGPDPEKTDNVMLKRKRISRILYNNKFFDYPISFSASTLKNFGLSLTIISGFSYLKSIIKKREETNLENFYINRFGKKLYSCFFEDYTEKLWGIHPTYMSADWGAQRVKGLSIKKVVFTAIKHSLHLKEKNIETSLIDEYLYPKYGPGFLWETMAKEIIKKGGKILLNSCVTKINISNMKIESIELNDSTRIDGDIFISSMPIKELIEAFTEKNDNIYNISNKLIYRDFVTVGLLVKKLKIKNTTKIKTVNNIPPDCWIYVQDSKVKLGRIQIFNNWSPYMVKRFEDSVWLGLEYFCNENDQFWNLSNKKCAEYAINDLITLNIINKEDVLDYHIERVQKAYPTYFGSYKQIDEVISYLNNIENLYCVGRNGQHRYNNMDHSMLTSIETVKCILNKKNSKHNIWKVNTEKDFHEIKK